MLISSNAYALKPVNWVVAKVFLDAVARGDMRDVIYSYAYSFSSKELCTEYLLGKAKKDSTASLSYDSFGMPLLLEPDNFNSLSMCVGILELPQNDSK